MRLVHPSRWPRALLVTLVGATFAGLFQELAAPILRSLGLPPQVGIVIAANILFPASILAAAVYYPRFRWVPACAILALVTFTTVRAVALDWHIWNWTPRLWLGRLHPVIAAATIASGALACLAIPLVRLARRVGLEDEALRCPACGYLLTGLAPGPCPECGRATSASAAPITAAPDSANAP